MAWPFRKSPKHEAKRVYYPRNTERIRTQNLNSPLGLIVDLSGSGARIRAPDKPLLEIGSSVDVAIASESQKLHLRGTIQWMARDKKTKLWEFGLRWTPMSEAEVAVIEQFARIGHVSQEFIKDHSRAAKAARAAPAPGSPSPGSPRQGSTGSSSPGPNAAKKNAPPNSGSNSGNSAKSESASTGASGARVDLEDLYAVLGVAADATSTQIHSAFRALAMKYHPDHNPAPEAASQFALVSKAYNVLKDPELRRKYDEFVRKFAERENAA